MNRGNIHKQKQNKKNVLKIILNEESFLERGKDKNLIDFYIVGHDIGVGGGPFTM